MAKKKKQPPPAAAPRVTGEPQYSPQVSIDPRYSPRTSSLPRSLPRPEHQIAPTKNSWVRPVALSVAVVAFVLAIGQLPVARLAAKRLARAVESSLRH